MIKVVNKIDSSAKRFQRVTSFKIYLTNPSLRCALFSPLLESDEAMGNMVETAIYAQWIQRDNTEVYYSNWQLGRGKCGEVDMVGLDVISQKPNWVVEVKWSDRYVDNISELGSLHHFLDVNNIDEAIVTSINKFVSKEIGSSRIQFIPSAIYAYIVGYNTIHRRALEVGL